MNLKFSLAEIDFSSIDFENVSSWPQALKVIFAAIMAVIVSIGAYFVLVDSQVSELKAAQDEELRLRQVFQVKYAAAVSLDLYRQQMTDMQDLLSKLLKRLPTSHETPGLLDDITNVGTSSGLNFVIINWLPEVAKEFYIELPITMEVVGDYHQFGAFVSRIADLPRIVTLHDFTVKVQEDGRLNLSIVAKTYRYRTEQQAVNKESE